MDGARGRTLPVVEPGRPTYASIDLDALRHNLGVVQKSVGGATRVLAVVKADAYGHGAVQASRTLVEAGAWGLAVSLVEEGLELRGAGIRAPVLVLGGVYPGLEDLVVQRRLTPVVWSVDHLDRMAAAVRRSAGGAYPVHVKVDTGMSRLGLLPEELPALLEAYAARHAGALAIEGVMTHLARADEADVDESERQLGRFRASLRVLADRGIEPSLRHVCNSAGIVGAADAHFDMVRPGIALYGGAATPQVALPGLRPSMSMHSHVAGTRVLGAGTKVSYGHRATLTRRSTLAIVPVGYEDGYMRAMSGQARMLVRGRSCAVVGNVTMDTSMVDVTDVEREDGPVEVGEPVTLMGQQAGAELTMFDLARWAGVIPYEILCGVSKRVPRR